MEPRPLRRRAGPAPRELARLCGLVFFFGMFRLIGQSVADCRFQ